MRAMTVRKLEGSSFWRHLLGALAIVLLTVTVALASGGGEGEGHEGPNWLNFLWRMINFIVLIGFLWWLLADKVKGFFGGRRDDIKKSLEEARIAKEEAEAKFREYSTKLEKATDEIKGITEMIKLQGQAEKDKIIEDAKKAAEKMKEDTQSRLEQELSKASNQLRAEAVELSVQMAGDLLKKQITPEDHDNMVKDYLDKVVS